MNVITDFILHSGIFINILIVYILLKKWKEAFHFRLLSIFFLWVLITSFCFYGFLNKNEVIFYTTFLFFDTISAVMGPLFYLYIKAKFLQKREFFKEDTLHFIVPLIYLFSVSVPKLLSSINNPEVFEHLRVDCENLFALINIYSTIYLIRTQKILRRIYDARPHHKSSYSDIKWFRKLFYSLIIMICVDNCITVFEVVYGDIHAAVPIVAFLAIFLILYLAYYGIFKSKVLLPDFLFQKEIQSLQKKLSEANVKPNTSSKKVLSVEEMKDLNAKLNKLMVNHKWFLDEDFSLSYLSKKMDISDKKLSYLLNQHIGASFSDYTNKLRIEEVKKRLRDTSNSNYTILAIAMDCGFNSKTSFNRTFSKVVGMTPSMYKSQQLKS